MLLYLVTRSLLILLSLGTGGLGGGGREGGGNLIFSGHGEYRTDRVFIGKSKAVD